MTDNREGAADGFQYLTLRSTFEARMRLLGYLQTLQTPTSPRCHANGFIQIDITPAVRLHVWGDPRIPKQATPTPIHDHAFGFTSRVLLGTLNQRTYNIEPAGPEADFAPEQHLYRIHRAHLQAGENTVLVPDGGLVAVTHESSQYISADDDDGETYSMEPGELHESVPVGPAVTVIVKRGKTLTQGGQSPIVLVPVGQKPSNDFDRHAATFEDMWQIVGDVMRGHDNAVALGLLWALMQERQMIMDRAAKMATHIVDAIT